MEHARAAILAADVEPLELSGRDERASACIAAATTHLAKGLEFKAVVVMACDDDVLPLRARLEGVANEVELDEVYETRAAPVLRGLHPGAGSSARLWRGFGIGVLRRHAAKLDA